MGHEKDQYYKFYLDSAQKAIEMMRKQHKSVSLMKLQQENHLKDEEEQAYPGSVQVLADNNLEAVQNNFMNDLGGEQLETRQMNLQLESEHQFQTAPNQQRGSTSQGKQRGANKS